MVCLYVKAYYWRGIAKIKMQNMKGIIDLNKSLALDKDLFQVVIVYLEYCPCTVNWGNFGQPG